MSINKPNINRRQFLILSGMSMGALALNACGSPPATPQSEAESTTAPEAASTEPQRGGTLRIAVSDSVTNLDPAIVVSGTDLTAGFIFYDRLTKRNEGIPGTPLTPELAESWEVSEDGLSHTFYLRQNAVFQHGTPVTAKDVLYTFERLLDPSLVVSLGPSLPPIQEIEIIDDYTVRFHLESPNVTLPFILSSPGAEIVPHDRTTEQIQQEPSGSGPFRLEEHIPGERTIFKRHEAYWHSDYPYVNEVQFLTIPERSTQIAALMSGEVDWVPQIGIENLPTLQAQADVEIHQSLQGMFPIFDMNVTEKPFDDVRVRQAIKHAIDREALRQVILQDYGAILNDQPIPPNSPFYADLPPLAYDPERAKALLVEAGYPDGLEVTLSVAEILPRIVDAAIVIQEMLKAVNITITLDKVPVDVYWAEKYMQTPFFVSWWDGLSEPDYVLSLSYISGGRFNETEWSDPEVDALIAQARETIDPEKRLQLYTEIQKSISQDGGSILPYITPIFMASRANVQGIVPEMLIRPEAVWLAEG